MVSNIKIVSRNCFSRYAVRKLWNNRIITNKNGLLEEKFVKHIAENYIGVSH